MKDFANGAWAVALLTLREAWRQRLWILLAVAGALLLAVVPQMRAVDETARLKLAVAALSGTIAFVTVLLGALIGAAALRRDVESRTGFLLFAKPLSHAAYLGGRWLGVVLALLVAVAVLSLLGTASTWMQLGRLPAPVAVAQPEERWRIENATAVAVAGDERPILLAGDPARGRGEGVRLRFAGLPTDVERLEVLVRIEVGGFSMGQPLMQSVVSLSARPPDGDAVLLPLHPDSPYGEDLYAERTTTSGRVFLRSREHGRRDLSQDYARFELPRSAIGPDGAVLLQLNRLEGGGRVRIDRDSVLVALEGGSFLANLLRASLVALAQAGLLAACTLMVVCVARLGTALLAALTLFFGGHGVRFIEADMQWHDFSRVGERLIELVLAVLPDFGRHQTEAALAASRHIPWADVGAAWVYFGAYSTGFLVVGWYLLRRREL